MIRYTDNEAPDTAIINTGSSIMLFYTIYDRSNVPDSAPFEVKRWYLTKESKGPQLDNRFSFQSSELDLCRDMMVNLHLTCIPRSEEDAPDVVETWL